MSTRSEEMLCYEQMAYVTERMWLLARTDQWSGLPELEANYSDWIERLQQLNANAEAEGSVLDEAQRQRQRTLLARIQLRHQGVCSLVAPQLARLSAVLRSLEWQASLHSAYSQPGQALL